MCKVASFYNLKPKDERLILHIEFLGKVRKVLISEDSKKIVKNQKYKSGIDGL